MEPDTPNFGRIRRMQRSSRSCRHMGIVLKLRRKKGRLGIHTSFKVDPINKGAFLMAFFRDRHYEQLPRVESDL